MKKINESFQCISCKKHIQAADKTCRNHCPYCFTSIHVDGDIPGDRNTNCHAIMRPISYEIKNGQTKILFKCTKCEKRHRNKASKDDDLVKLSNLLAPN